MEKKTLNDIFVFNNNRPHIKYTAKKIQNVKEKKIKTWRAINKSTKIPKYFWNFLISKKDSFDQM